MYRHWRFSWSVLAVKHSWWTSLNAELHSECVVTIGWSNTIFPNSGEVMGNHGKFLPSVRGPCEPPTHKFWGQVGWCTESCSESVLPTKKEPVTLGWLVGYYRPIRWECLATHSDFFQFVFGFIIWECCFIACYSLRMFGFIILNNPVPGYPFGRSLKLYSTSTPRHDKDGWDTQLPVLSTPRSTSNLFGNVDTLIHVEMTLVLNYS